MAHQPDNHSSGTEKKPVAFSVPLILGAVTMFIILLFVSLGDPSHKHVCECKENCSKECMEACERGDHSMHPEGMKHEEGHGAATHEEHATEAKATESTTTAPAEEHKAEEHKEEAHH